MPTRIHAPPVGELDSPVSGLLVSDLDGTLLFQGSGIHPREVDCLEGLGRRGVIRAIATGRSCHSVRNVLPADFPIDYLIFSSGAGIVDWATGALLTLHNLDETQVAAAVEVFLSEDLDFMVHDPIPDSSRFMYRYTGRLNPDFESRLAQFSGQGVEFLPGAAWKPASQVLGICPKGDPDSPFQTLCRKLPGLSVVRATSPLDGKSIWLEAFSPHVSKAKAAEWVAQRHGLSAGAALAVGNDFNDWDLLRWAGKAFVMRGAPAALLAAFPCVEDANRDGVSRAVAQWLGG